MAMPFVLETATRNAVQFVNYDKSCKVWTSDTGQCTKCDSVNFMNFPEVFFLYCVDPSGNALLGVSVMPLSCWGLRVRIAACGLDVCLLWVLCVLQLEVSASGWSLVQRSPTELGCLSMMMEPWKWGNIKFALCAEHSSTKQVPWP